MALQTRPEPPTRSRSSDTSKPRNGDVIVSAMAAPKVGFGLRQLPGAVHLIMSRREVAAEVARRFAERYGVDVWFDGGTFTLLASFRRATG
jgi:hypothetical protein